MPELPILMDRLRRPGLATRGLPLLLLNASQRCRFGELKALTARFGRSMRPEHGHLKRPRVTMSDQTPDFPLAESGSAADHRAPSCLVLHGLGGGPYEVGPADRRDPRRGDRTSWHPSCRVTRVPARSCRPRTGGTGPPRPRPRSMNWRPGDCPWRCSVSPRARPWPSTWPLGAPSTGLFSWLRSLAIRYTGLIPLRPASYLRHLAQVLPDIPRRPPAVRDPEMRRRAAQAEPIPHLQPPRDAAARWSSSRRSSRSYRGSRPDPDFPGPPRHRRRARERRVALPAPGFRTEGATSCSPAPTTWSPWIATATW